MKKSALAIIAILSAISFTSNAQTWSGSTPGDIYYNSGNVGIGTTSPSTKLSIYDNSNTLKMPRLIKDGYYDELGLYNYSATDYYRTDLSFRRARGTAASPAASQSGDWLGSFSFWAANSGASFSNPSASIVGIVDGTPGSSYVPGKIVFQTSDGSATTTDRMTIKNNGHVAIGTGDGSDLLTVAGNTRVVAYAGNGFLGYDAATGGNHVFSLTRQSNDLALSALGGIGFSTLKTSPSASYSMFINTSGDVGIGTTSPSTKLSIYDNSNTLKMPRLIKDGYYDELGLYNYSATDYYRTDLSFRRARGTAASPAASQSGDWLGSFSFWAANSGASFSNPSASIVGIVDGTPGSSYVPGKIVFQTSDGSATTTDRMTIKNNGKVGIGTTTPDQLLSVNGTIHSKEVLVDLTGWPDFVFKPTYKLPALTEVKTYIDKNQHLPEIPSAQEIEQNGLNVGEMNKLLMKKVEELTLYLIEQNKRIEKLESQIKH
ncbi:hypothetical protein HQ865_15310 [Mucilaginibacter mali]|uniref:Peptidase S74 domain-containing protein n=1 Tax=Mucilaginibacter mali TaxID=2740462 RepID=A0A7D4QCC5_9SPHI|nr:hypothetical protein [Mucilaginibacter mali]QKJ31064.1 hypothetical protein HQ865_15310 [Mucilaginibacter mali]